MGQYGSRGQESALHSRSGTCLIEQDEADPGHVNPVIEDPSIVLPPADGGRSARRTVELGEEARERTAKDSIETAVEAKRIIELGVEDLSSKSLLKLFDYVDTNIELEIRNEFVVNGDQAEVSLTAEHIAFVRKKSSMKGFYNLKRTVVPFEDIVAVKNTCSGKTVLCRPHAPETSSQPAKFSFANLFRRRRVVRKDEEAVSASRQSGNFLHSMADTLHIYYVPNSSQNNKFTLAKLSLQHDDPEIISHWSSLVAESIPTKGRPQRLLVFINPHGGKGQAPTLFKGIVFPLFQQAGIDCKVIMTERANHALDLLQTLPLAHLDGVISVGGDGMFAEVFNGVLQRTARDAGLDPTKGEFITPTLKVGFIPGGSTDCTALCLHGNNDPVTAALHIILGDHIQCDAATIKSAQGIERICLNMISYGYFGDLIRRSERLRWMGPNRYTFAGISTFLLGRSYSGTLSYRGTQVHVPPKLGPPCGRGCSQCRPVEVAPAHTESDSHKGEFTQITGKFMAISSVMMTCKSPQTKHGMSPAAHFGDGNSDLIIVKKTSRLNYLRYLFRIATHWSHPFDLPFVEAVRVQEFNFQPKDGNRNSVWNCDGELVHEPGIQVNVHRQLVPVFARGIYCPEVETAGSRDSNYNSRYQRVFNDQAAGDGQPAQDPQ